MSSRGVWKSPARVLLALVLAACATTGAEGEGDKGLPTTGVGPFRKLDAEEVKGIAPFVLDDSEAIYREPAALRDGEATLLYAVGARDGRDVIVRSRALDQRTFFGTSGHFGKKPAVVLAPDAGWEGGGLSGPFAYRANGEILLFYAAGGGIGLARSTDGLAFRKEPGPVLGIDPAAAWETTPPRAPTVYALPDGRLRMLYAAGVSIGEAESNDGVRWTRLGSAPVLGPAPMPPPGSLLPNEKPPFDTEGVSDPCAIPRTTPAGRFHVRVLYTGFDAAGGSTIGFAGRYGDSGAFDRQPLAVYSVGQKERAPAFVEAPEGAFLYIQQEKRPTSGERYFAIASAFSPGNVKLPTPLDFPDAP